MRNLVILLVFATMIILAVTEEESEAQPFGLGDCNDTNGTINPGQPEICFNHVDDDCDLAIDCADTECAGQQGPNNHLCCPNDAGDCSAGYTPGTCGTNICVQNECFTQEDQSRCTPWPSGPAPGPCADFIDSCSTALRGPWGNSSHPYLEYTCLWQGDHSLCDPNCDDICGAAFTCEFLPSNACSLNHGDCVIAAGDPFLEPTDPAQCLCHELFPTCPP